MGSGLPASAAPGAAPGSSNNNRLEGLLDRLVRRYRQLRNYADHGFVRDRRRHGQQVHFETFYKAPALFRFEFRRPHPFRPLRDHVTCHAVGCDRIGPYFWSRSYAGDETLDRDEPLGVAVARATGISLGSAHTIAALLFDQVGGSELLRLRRVRRCRGATMDGTPCFGLTGRHPARGQVTVFVGKKDLLIRGLVYRRLQKIQVRQGVRAHGLRREVAAALVSASGPPAGC